MYEKPSQMAGRCVLVCKEFPLSRVRGRRGGKPASHLYCAPLALQCLFLKMASLERRFQSLADIPMVSMNNLACGFPVKWH
jgi:hypothetical protein